MVFAIRKMIQTREQGTKKPLPHPMVFSRISFSPLPHHTVDKLNKNRELLYNNLPQVLARSFDPFRQPLKRVGPMFTNNNTMLEGFRFRGETSKPFSCESLDSQALTHPHQQVDNLPSNQMRTFPFSFFDLFS